MNPDGSCSTECRKCGAAAVRAELQNLQFPLEQVMVISFDSAVLAEAKRQMPQVKTSWLCGFHGLRGGWTPTIEEILKVLHECRVDGLDANAHECVDRTFVRKLREAGKGFTPGRWTCPPRRNGSRSLVSIRSRSTAPRRSGRRCKPKETTFTTETQRTQRKRKNSNGEETAIQFLLFRLRLSICWIAARLAIAGKKQMLSRKRNSKDSVCGPAPK